MAGLLKTHVVDHIQTISESVEDAGPISLSFPALLRNPRLPEKYTHLQVRAGIVEPRPAPTVPRKNKREEREGKKWVRRKENAQFAGNPHIVLATKKDFAVVPPRIRTTFPAPLPAYLPRSALLPPTTAPLLDPATANAGQFSLSMKGMRKELRRWGTRAEALVRDLEEEITSWLHSGIFSSSLDGLHDLHFPGTVVKNRDSIRELSRTPLRLVWLISDDAFARYVVHCCARYHNVVSFSKELSGQRVTYLLRPNVSRTNRHATPPVSDFEYSSQIDSDIEFVSEYGYDTRSDAEAEESESEHQRNTALHSLSRISETEAVETVQLARFAPGSALEETDGDGDESASDGEGGIDLTASVESLALRDDLDYMTPNAVTSTRPSPLRLRSRADVPTRSTSSPSRSPFRRPPRRLQAFVSSRRSQRRSFYDYLFS